MRVQCVRLRLLPSFFCVSLRPQIYADRATLEFFRRPSPIGDMKQMYRQQYEQADYARLRHSDTKIVGIYDDHDYGEETPSGALRLQGSGEAAVNVTARAEKRPLTLAADF